MFVLDLTPTPNQAISYVDDDGVLWALTFKVANKTMCVDIDRQNIPLLRGQRVVADCPIIPYRHLSESGNFIFMTENDELPWYENFGASCQLLYVSAAEIGLRDD